MSAELKECTKTAKRWSQEAAAVRKVHVDEQKEFLAVVKSAVGPLAVPVSATSSEGVAKEGDSDAMDVYEVKEIVVILLLGFRCAIHIFF